MLAFRFRTFQRRKHVRFFAPIPIAVLQFHALAVRDVVGNLRVSVRVDAPLLRIVAHRIFVGTIIGMAGILVFFENARRIVVNAYAYVRHNRSVFYDVLFFPEHIFAVFPRVPLGNFNGGRFFFAPRRTSERCQKHRAHRAIYNSFHNPPAIYAISSGSSIRCLQISQTPSRFTSLHSAQSSPLQSSQMPSPFRSQPKCVNVSKHLSQCRSPLLSG